MVVHTIADLAGEQHRALGLAHAVAGEPARGRDERLRRSRDGSQPRRVSSHHTSSSAFQIGAACSPTGRSVGIAPQITQPPPSRKRDERDGVVEIERADVEVHEARPGVEREPKVAAAAHVHRSETAGRGERGRQQVGRELTVDESQTIGSLLGPGAPSAGSSKNNTSAASGKTRGDKLFERTGPRTRRTGAERERVVDVDAGLDQRDTERERPRASAPSPVAAGPAARRRRRGT